MLEGGSVRESSCISGRPHGLCDRVFWMAAAELCDEGTHETSDLACESSETRTLSAGLVTRALGRVDRTSQSVGTAWVAQRAPRVNFI